MTEEPNWAEAEVAKLVGVHLNEDVVTVVRTELLATVRKAKADGVMLVADQLFVSADSPNMPGSNVERLAVGNCLKGMSVALIDLAHNIERGVA